MVRWTTTGGGSYTEAQADSAANAEALGIVSAVADADNFTLAVGGQVTGLSGLTAGTVYFLSDSVAGALTATEPSGDGEVSKPLLVALSSTSGIFFNYRGMLISPASGGSGVDVGAELDYATRTSDLTVTAGSEAAANTVITGASISFDGSTRVQIEFWCPFASSGSGVLVVVIVEDSTVIGTIVQLYGSGTVIYAPLYGSMLRTPLAGSHTYYVKAWRTGSDGTIAGGAGGSGTTSSPAVMRVTVA